MILRKSGEITLVKHLISGSSISPIVEEHMKGEWYMMDAYKGSGKYYDASGNVFA